jgi:1,4-dihydroxy-2-naphthoate polyprenyltransferase
VFTFFGVVAVAGTAFLQTGRLEPLALAASLPVGALATAILVVNNVRDRKSDARSGKWTLAVRLGERTARAEYVGLVAFAYLAITGLALASGAAVLIALLPAPLAIREVRRFLARDGAALNASLAATAGLHLATGLLLAVGLAG